MIEKRAGTSMQLSCDTPVAILRWTRAMSVTSGSIMIDIPSLFFSSPQRRCSIWRTDVRSCRVVPEGPSRSGNRKERTRSFSRGRTEPIASWRWTDTLAEYGLDPMKVIAGLAAAIIVAGFLMSQGGGSAAQESEFELHPEHVRYMKEKEDKYCSGTFGKGPALHHRLPPRGG